MSDVKVESHVGQVLQEFESKKARALEMIGLQGERNAVLEVDKMVYSTPESPNYLRTGALRRDITHGVEGDTAYIGQNTEYAPYVNLGTVHMKARPYLKSAVVEHVDEYKDILESVMKE